jgi:hypothetical protein
VQVKFNLLLNECYFSSLALKSMWNWQRKMKWNKGKLKFIHYSFVVQKFHMNWLFWVWICILNGSYMLDRISTTIFARWWIILLKIDEMGLQALVLWVVKRECSTISEIRRIYQPWDVILELPKWSRNCQCHLKHFHVYGGDITNSLTALLCRNR